MSKEKQKSQQKHKYPMMPMRNLVVFPQMTVPFFVGRPMTIKALETAITTDQTIFLVAQRNTEIENPTQDDLYNVGVIGEVKRVMKLSNGTFKVLFEGRQRARLKSFSTKSKYYTAEIELIEDEKSEPLTMTALAKNIQNELKKHFNDSQKPIEMIRKVLQDSADPNTLADRIAPFLDCDSEKLQEILESPAPQKRLELLYERMLEEHEFKKVEKKLKERVQGQIGKVQKEYYLNEQLKAIQNELGEGDDGKAEIEEYTKSLSQTKLSQEAHDVVAKELKKLSMMQPMSSEANVVRNYIDWILNMPWEVRTKDRLSLKRAEQILDADHYGLEKIKERIIEYLAVAQRVGSLRGPIICLVGPPGVGKTSLARSVARALDRNFARISLGGVSHESDIRGHRRTYIGAMPGRIIQTLKKTNTCNPLILLDEIDKMVSGVMGDPAAALLEVLDREQNSTFMDHYLEVEFDLSDILFFCTANVISDIPPALRDRMEVVTLSGYTELEKLHIAKKHLIPRQMLKNGLIAKNISFKKKSTEEMIQHYTAEAGVRNLERTISKVCRKVARQIVENENIKSVPITSKRILEFLGPPRYKHEASTRQNEIGITYGLAWTQVGGEMLTTQVCLTDGDGKLKLTGNLGEVMKESARAALSYIHANAESFGLDSKIFQEKNVHLHVPEGAIPKDGPSAGVTIATSLLSILTDIPVLAHVAMTGEITLRGNVMPIGGLKEKLLAAKRGNITHVIIPHENEKDLIEIPSEIKDSLTITPVKFVSEVFELALEHLPTPLQSKVTTQNQVELENTPPNLLTSQVASTTQAHDAS